MPHTNDTTERHVATHATRRGDEPPHENGLQDVKSDGRRSVIIRQPCMERTHSQALVEAPGSARLLIERKPASCGVFNIARVAACATFRKQIGNLD